MKDLLKKTKVAIVTISDRGAKGERTEDVSGDVLEKMVKEQGAEVVARALVPDEAATIQQVLTELCEKEPVELILTTGGTGVGPRDCTPEATKAVIDKEVPGMAEAMRAASLAVTKNAMLSRGIVGLRGSSLIVNLPGSPKAVKENLEVILPVLPHTFLMIRGIDAH